MNQTPCSQHENPDIWFPEMNRKPGKKSRFIMARQLRHAAEAISICNSCPVKTQCLAEGLKSENLEHGIWGGLMPAERMVLVGAKMRSTTRQEALAFAEKVAYWRNSE